MTQRNSAGRHKKEARVLRRHCSIDEFEKLFNQGKRIVFYFHPLYCLFHHHPTLSPASARCDEIPRAVPFTSKTGFVTHRKKLPSRRSQPTPFACFARRREDRLVVISEAEKKTSVLTKRRWSRLAIKRKGATTTKFLLSRSNEVFVRKA